ncbi:helix-turn-helix domain-containing protein [Parapedobacter tibetensis]|uniref:helix-turn-helix domain-containing protein n=1 Tax=Parapedobacter tibetensis TaxID=2972951 RepID=UPI00214D7CAB|nr:helix-turn-helix domain-containing protein [Parapedobacter tibetensis]
MEVSNKNDDLSSIVGHNVKSLRKQAGLTIEGLTFALSISISYMLMIERGAANISSKLAKKIADFFDVGVAQLYMAKPVKLKSPLKTPTIAAFYRENVQNPKFFISRIAEYSVANFLRNILLEDSIMVDGHTVGQLAEYGKEKYKRALNSQELSRELRRLYQKGILDREDKFGNGSVYLYKLKTD